MNSSVSRRPKKTHRSSARARRRRFESDVSTLPGKAASTSLNLRSTRPSNTSAGATPPPLLLL